jgi:predicted phosphoserine aminotransferase
MKPGEPGHVIHSGDWTHDTRSKEQSEMTRPTAFGRFFLTGPTEVRPEVLAAMNHPVIGHRGPDMADLMGGMNTRLSSLFGTGRPVYLSTSSATGFMEAAVTNLSRRRILCLVCGAFSQRFYDIATACGRPADRLDVEWGTPNMPQAVHEMLSRQRGRYDLVTVVHSETSTGVLNPVRDIAAAVREFDDVMIAVDTVSSMGGAPVLMDDWGLDFVLTGSQKALALPPGLALAAASERALERAAGTEPRGYYFDLLKFDKNCQKLQTPNTPVVSLFYALSFQLERIFQEGLETRWQRHEAMAQRTYTWVDALADRTGEAFDILAPAGYRSPTVTVIRLPEGREGPRTVADMRARGYTIAAGYGKWKPTAIRIGHMGDHTLEGLEELLAVLTDVLGE